jgi:putative transposase
MKKSRFSETQIVGILKAVESGGKVEETCRKHGISVATYYQWKSKYAGLEVSQLSELRDLKSENARLKKMYADLALVHYALQDAVAKKL